MVKRRKPKVRRDERIQPPFAHAHPFSMSKQEREGRKALWEEEQKKIRKMKRKK